MSRHRSCGSGLAARCLIHVITLSWIGIAGCGEAGSRGVSDGTAEGPVTPKAVYGTTTVDLGPVPVRTEPYRAEVRVCNAGRSPLTFREVRTGCGCTEVTLSRNPIPAGSRA